MSSLMQSLFYQPGTVKGRKNKQRNKTINNSRESDESCTSNPIKTGDWKHKMLERQTKGPLPLEAFTLQSDGVEGGLKLREEMD
jgi:hypothetical protein